MLTRKEAVSKFVEIITTALAARRNANIQRLGPKGDIEVELVVGVKDVQAHAECAFSRQSFIYLTGNALNKLGNYIVHSLASGDILIRTCGTSDDQSRYESIIHLLAATAGKE